MYLYWLWLVLLCFQQSMILTVLERLGSYKHLQNRGQAYTRNVLSLGECGVFWQDGVSSATTCFNISLVEEAAPVKALNFPPLFHRWDSGCHLLGTLPHAPSGMLGKGLLQPPASWGGSAQTLSRAEHTPLPSAMPQCNAAAAPLPSQPVGLQFVDRLDVVT